MFKLNSFFNSRESHEQEEFLLRQVLSSKTAAIISARCCVPKGIMNDEIIETNLKKVLKEKKLDWPIILITITQAQSAIEQVGSQLSPIEQELIQEVQALVLNHGLYAFPVLVLNQRLVSFGGAPTQEKLLEFLENKQNV